MKELLEDSLEDLAWKWDPSPAHQHENFIRIDSFQEILAFGGRRDGATMVVVEGDQNLANNSYHCWTIFIQGLWDAEVMVGVATEKAKFTGSWNEDCRLGMDEHSWALSSGGYASHKREALVHEDYRFFPKDYITVHLNLLNNTLMFAINSRMLGIQYTNVGKGVRLYPVVGVARRSEIQLVSAHFSPASLQLRSLMAYIAAQYKAKAGSSDKIKMPKTSPGAQLLWLGTVPLERYGLPPGLIKDIGHRWPWVTQKMVHRTRTRFRKNNGATTGCVPQVPRVLTLIDPFEEISDDAIVNITELSERRICRRRVCSCIEPGLENTTCCHEQVLRFFRKREICYVSSSDDEIFINSSRKKNKKKKKQKS